MKFSANLGFLWNDRPLADAIHAAYEAGFDAVECHWPYDQPVPDVQKALHETGLSMLGLNTSRGDTTKGENGLSALPGREAEARQAIDQAVATARAFGAKCIHVMAGYSDGSAAEKSFVENLKYASSAAQDLTILIEPLNHYDAPGYFLKTSGQALDIIGHVGAANVKLMFDCYHLQIMEGDLTRRLKACLPFIGHIQIASVPDRGPPNQGEVNYTHIFELLSELGYDQPIGAEYKPVGSTEDSLDWLLAFKS